MKIEKVTIKLSELQTLARTECLLVWDRMITDKNFNKSKIIARLYYEDKLNYDEYAFDCPFCHYLRFTSRNKFKNECVNCIWPYNKEIDISPETRCLNSHYPFGKFFHANNNDVSLKYANQVFGLLENTQIENSNRKITVLIGDEGDDE